MRATEAWALVVTLSDNFPFIWPSEDLGINAMYLYHDETFDNVLVYVKDTPPIKV